MKVSAASLVALVGVCLFSGVTAQVGGINVPNCAKPCVAQLLASPICPTADIKCICTSKTLISNVACCVKKRCPASMISKASKFADKTCALVGVTNLPQQASCPSGSAPGASSKTASSAPSKTASTKAPSKPSKSPSANAAAMPVANFGAVGGAALGLMGVLI